MFATICKEEGLAFRRAPSCQFPVLPDLPGCACMQHTWLPAQHAVGRTHARYAYASLVCMGKGGCCMHVSINDIMAPMHSWVLPRAYIVPSP